MNFSSELWDEYRVMRTEMKKPMTQTGERWAMKHLENISGGNPRMADAILQQSLSNGWRGLFTLKGDTLDAFRKSERDSIVNRKQPCEYCGKLITESSRFSHEDNDCPNYKNAPKDSVVNFVNNFKLGVK